MDPVRRHINETHLFLRLVLICSLWCAIILGKSAIVAAIQLCLGARSSATGRGSSLSGFVREGSQGPAICRIYVHNQGPDAFEPERFGSQICIERKIPKSGAATYAISSFLTGKFVVESNDRRVIDSMLRSYNIQIENPCSVLTQEEAKRFIQGNEKSRYQFFLRVSPIKNQKSVLNYIQWSYL